MDIETALEAIASAAPGAPSDALKGFAAVYGELPAHAALATPWRLAALIGQTAAESAGYRRMVEDLRYSAGRLLEVWPARFATLADAEPYAGRPEALANRVYGGRGGNDRESDGWRYRGRGYIQLTFRDNYRWIGQLIGVDLEAAPDALLDPETAWRASAAYMQAAPAWDHADRADDRAVTLAVNGGLHDLAGRVARTARAAAVLAPLPDLAAMARRRARDGFGSAVMALQIALEASGFDPGPVDGLWGPRTLAALADVDRA